jgi:hypothetical protein
MNNLFHLKKSLLMLALLWLVACRTDDTRVSPVIPEESTTGKHTFGFLLGDQAWVNYGKRCLVGNCDENLTGTYDASPAITVNAYQFRRKDGKVVQDQNFGFTLENCNRPGLYYASGRRIDQSVGFVNRDPLTGEAKTYVPDSTKAPFVIDIIRLDTAAKVVSGRFHGVLYESFAGPDSVVISSGRFDVRLQN